MMLQAWALAAMVGAGVASGVLFWLATTLAMANPVSAWPTRLAKLASVLIYVTMVAAGLIVLPLFLPS